MFHFIFGDAGSGKSRYIYEKISQDARLNPQQRYYLFVPEQNTLHAQQEIIRCSRVHGMLNLDVLSFQLLAYRVMEELGIRQPVLLDDISKAILIRKAVMDCAGELKVYAKKKDAGGFISQLRTLITEFYQYGITPEDLKGAEEKASGRLLKGKLSDIRMIYESFILRLRDGISVPEEMPVLLLKNIAASALLNDVVIIFDGFTGFTPVQMKLLEHILTKAKDVSFAVTIPPEAGPYRRGRGQESVSELYWLSRETVAKISEAAEKNRVAKGEDICLHREAPKPLVDIVAASDPVDEVRYMVRDIRKRALLEKTPFRRMAVAVTDPASYGEILKREMTKASIPWFMDTQADAYGSPAVEMIRAALSVITESYSFNEVMRCLRNPLKISDQETRERTDLLENRLRKEGIRGRERLKNALKDAELQMDEIFSLHDRLKEAGTLSGKTDALLKYCEEAKIFERAEALSERLTGKGMEREALEISRVTGQIPLLFSRLKAVLGEENISMRDFARLIEAGFGDLKTGMLPAKVDVLQVGDLKRSRFDDIDVLYILGANEGSLPSAVSGGGIFTDREREEMERSRLELAPDDKTDSCIQLFYLYMIMHKPCRRIVISFSLEGRDGRGRKPSEVVGELLLGRYHGFRAKALKKTEETIQPAVSYEDALSLLAELLGSPGKDPERLKGIRKLLEEDPVSSKRAKALIGEATRVHDEEKLSPETAARLYKETLSGSVTRIEQFEGCPFSHFLKYGLRLKKRQEFDIEALDIGNLFHRSLDQVFRMAAAGRLPVQAIDDHQLMRMCEDAVQLSAREYHDSIMESSARSRYIAGKVLKITKRTLWALKQQLLQGGFETFGTEVPFRYREEKLDLHGVIDRVDCCAADNRVLVKVIDYKSGSTKFDLKLVKNGLQLQLVTYMDMAMKLAESHYPKDFAVEPAGMFYYHIQDPVIDYKKLSDAGTEENTDRERLDALRMDGAVSEDAAAVLSMDKNLAIPEEMKVTAKELRRSSVISSKGTCTLSREGFDVLMADTNALMQQDADRILQGEIRVKPYRNGTKTRCDYCEYHSVCGFNDQLPGFSYRKLTSLSEKS